ncbi:hypothetical protein BDZ89DRAFT_1073917 [Hymenopellis radicata]|nr:hypothetical protein BDZ89DRAFT_1073917 [Hymenopellis radicata]
MSKLPLEIKSLIISELEPPPHPVFDLEIIEKEEAAYHRDLRAVCLVWPDTIRIIRKILFRHVSLRVYDHDLDTSLRNLCQALENDPSVATFVQLLELSDDDDQVCPMSDHPLFNSVVSFVPKMDHLTILVIFGIHNFMSTESIASLCASQPSQVATCKLGMCKFSDVRAFCTFLSCWTTAGLYNLEIKGLSLRPNISHVELSRALRVFVNDWDNESTWIRWNMVDKPHRSSFLSVRTLEFIFPEPTHAKFNGGLMAMDLFGSTQWSPLKAMENLQVLGAFMENSLVHRINNLVHRYHHMRNCKLVNIPFDFSSVESITLSAVVDIDLNLMESDGHGVDCYIKSLAAVRSESRLRTVKFYFYVDRAVSGSIDDSWERLDTALSGDPLELEAVNFYVCPRASNGGKTFLVGLRGFLLEHVFPKIAAKYFLASGARSALTILEELFDPTRQ